MKKFFVYMFVLTVGASLDYDAYAQQTLTAPAEHLKKELPTRKEVETKSVPLSAADEESTIDLRAISVSVPRFEFTKVDRKNEYNLALGFYASFAPPTSDTIEVFEGGTDQREVINVAAGKEILFGDSLDVLKDMRVRYANIQLSRPLPKAGKTNSTVTRSGFIPGQGFGTNRFRFAVRPGKFILSRGAMVTASVHMTKEKENIGNILCAITGIDYVKNVFYVEASNEIPKGENINWVIINYPDTFSIR